MDKQLTKKQRIVFNVIKKFIEDRKKSPTFSELKSLLFKQGMKIRSNNSISQYLNVIEDKGYIQRIGKYRSIKLLSENSKNFVSLPLFGKVNCGEALNFADDNIEKYISISKKYARENKQKYFFVEAVGSSMDKENINDGDLILAKKIDREPEINEKIVAVINGLATVKKYQKINNDPVLMPNSTSNKHQPIILHPDDQIFIAGKVEKVFNFSKINSD